MTITLQEYFIIERAIAAALIELYAEEPAKIEEVLDSTFDYTKGKLSIVDNASQRVFVRHWNMHDLGFVVLQTAADHAEPHYGNLLAIADKRPKVRRSRGV